MIRALSILLTLSATPVAADALTTIRAIRPATILSIADLAVLPDKVPGAFRDMRNVVGQETRVTLYPGHPIRPGDIGPPSLVDRNQLVELVYLTGTLTIRTEGRALDKGAAGDRVRVMNLSSRSTVSGVVSDRGVIIVSPMEDSS